MTSNIDIELDNLRRTEQIKDWSSSLGYGEAEYTIEFKPESVPNLKLLAKKLNEKYGARHFTKHNDNGTIAVRFVVTL
jgi:hypothetical protein